MGLLLSKLSQKQFDNYASNPPQSILLIAPKGSGKKTILTELALQIAKDNKNGGIFALDSKEGKKTVGIDSIRELKHTLKLKSAQKRVVVIANSEKLTQEAQNSFLKLLEEPPENVHFLLGANNQSDLLSTIKSRSTIWRLSPPPDSQIYDYFNNYPKQELDKAILIAQGRVGLISSLLKKSTDHQMLRSIESAKEILSSNHFKRLTAIDNFTKDLDKTVDLLDAMAIVSIAALEQSITTNQNTASKWADRVELILDSKQQVLNNIQIKLVLSKLFLVI